MTPQTSTDAITPRRSRRAILAAILGTQLVVGLLTAGGVYLAYGHLNGNIAAGDPIEHVANKHEVEGPKQPLNILVLGSDSREGEGNNIDGQEGIGERADTTILLHVSADRRNAFGVSLPRDAIVDRPDCKMKGDDVPGADDVMFNTAFAVGGAQCAVQTVESLTDVYIDHFLVLDFNGFKDMVEAVNGVEVCIPKDVDDDQHNIHFDAGTQVLTGQDALNYVRERTVLSVTGDIGRMKRQQAFLASLVNKVLSAGTLSQPSRIYGFLNAVTSSIKVDDKLDSVRNLFDLATEFRNTGLDKIKFITVPIAEYPLDPNRLIWTDKAEGLWKEIIADKPLGKNFKRGSIGADDPPIGQDKSESDAEEQARLDAGLCA